jgi:hypothetical protein
MTEKLEDLTLAIRDLIEEMRQFRAELNKHGQIKDYQAEVNNLVETARQGMNKK